MKETALPPEPIRVSPTALDYVELRDYSLSYFHHTGEVVRFDRPCLAHRNHAKFLIAVQNRIGFSGEVHVGPDPSEIVPVIPAHLDDLGERDRARSSLAHSLFLYCEKAARVRNDEEEVAIYEGLAALQVARYRNDPDLLAEAAELADEAQDSGRPYVVVNR